MATEFVDELRSDWDPHDPVTAADYKSALARLRETAPVAWSDRWGGFFTLTKYEDVVAASKNPAVFTATKMTVIPSSPRKGLSRLPLQKDPPESDRYRKGLNLFFKQDKVHGYEPGMRKLADRLAGDLSGEVDFSLRWVEPFTQGALGILVGLDVSEALEVGRLSHEYVEKVQNQDLPAAGELSRLIDGFAIDLVADRLADPRNPETDIVSGLMGYPAEGGAYTSDELAGMVRLMLIGGHVVPRNFLCSVAWHMATHPEHLTLLRDDPASERGMIDELLRYYPANQALVRVTTCDTEIRGVKIPKDTPVALNFLSSNFDADVFDAPDEFDPTRSPNRHIAFGIGPHMCLGLAFAKLQTRVLLDMLKATKSLAVVGAPKWAKWTEYGITSLTLDIRR